jgi:hypothetical protein
LSDLLPLTPAALLLHIGATRDVRPSSLRASTVTEHVARIGIGRLEIPDGVEHQVLAGTRYWSSCSRPELHAATAYRSEDHDCRCTAMDTFDWVVEAGMLSMSGL